MRNKIYTIAKSSLVFLLITTLQVPSFAPIASAAEPLYDGNLIAPSVTQEKQPENRTQKTDVRKTTASRLDSLAVLGLADVNSSAASAQERLPTTVQKLEKHDYKADEDVVVTINNPEGEALETEVLNEEGQEVAAVVEQIDTGTITELHIVASNQLKPGKYTVEVTDEEGNTTTQDFTWGVLALNIDKAIYQPQETAAISIAVLDEKGAMVCDAEVELRIESGELRINDVLSTDDGTIVVNKECESTQFTLKPDYEATYVVGDGGDYKMTLTAKTENGTYTITDRFVVEDVTDFVIKRTSATRLYPPTEYPMLIEVTAKEDFTGTITETVPESFTITPSDAAQTYDALQTMYLEAPDPAIRLEQKVLGENATSLVMPFAGSYVVSQGFGTTLTDIPLREFYAHYGLSGHDGIDFALPTGTPLFAVDEGTILWSGQGDYGVTIIIQHTWGRSYYGHLSKTSVEKNIQVEKGALIGYSGNTGESTGPHLHFGIKPNTHDTENGYRGKIDPLSFLPLDATSVTNSLSLSFASAVLAASTSAEATADKSDSADVDTVEASASGETDQSIPTEALGAAEVKLDKEITEASLSAAEKFEVFNEEIVEEVAETQKIGTQKVKVIKWDVSLKKGEKTTLSYTYKAPMVSPQFYLLGPLKFFEGDTQNTLFEERRQWQIAADAIGVGWYDYNWRYRKQITIDNINIPSTQTNFPVLINLSSDSDLSANTRSDANDILFTDSTGKTKLSHEVETYTTGTGALVAWVKIPSLSSSADTDIYLYYGNDAATNQEDVANVWTNGFVGVWHLNESVSDGTAGLTDSAGSLDITPRNLQVGGGGTAVTGKVGFGVNLDGSNDYIDMGDNLTLAQGRAEMTVSTWFKSDSEPNGTEKLVDISINNGGVCTDSSRIELDLQASGGSNPTVNFLVRSPDSGGGQQTAYPGTDDLDAGNWYYATGVADLDEASERLKYFINNVKKDDDTRSSLSGDTDNTTSACGAIGTNADGSTGNNLDGQFDEVRISSVARSDDWITTEYNTMNSPSTFYSVGGVETKIYAPTNNQLMRHGNFFDSTGAEQIFVF